ncbi:imidazolonepropionase [Ramlibacter solisilvae]|uniref:Imidazolonepropionase n=1 Tax=Ramlibacter tataouinensis TaxID=94132 RepID=A0A127JQV2_9BURK|nr:imidazolonepropionase [Ramlibacter tataouinensis]AMO22418.1 imidazolonepropionase [Ramlibacter tataouinensis]
MNVQVWTNARVATLAADAPQPYGLIEDGALAVEDGRIAWVGARAELPAAFRATAAHDAQGALITPGLIDCHTHLVWGGDRAGEFEARLRGASYEEIARAGGGIVSTVKATREADEATLLAQSRRRLRALLAEGVTTLEIKSGYGLAEAAEAKCLRVARRLGELERVAVRTTFLGAHALPPEFAGRADDYIASVCDMLPRLHAQGLVDAVDAFCETIGFSTAQTRRVFEAARALGLPVKLHAEQLSDSGGAELAASFGALSSDHLEWLSETGARAMAQAGSVAVLLPGAFYFLRDTKVPPIALLREHGVPMAVSTDCNPGTSPCTSLLLMLNMACTLFRLTPEEALAGVTRHAARALGLADRGVLAPGLRADFVLWDVRSPAELAYALGLNPCRATIVQGQAR